MMKQQQIKIGLILILIFSSAYCQISGDPATVTTTISNYYNTLQAQLQSLKIFSLQITNTVKSTSQYTSMLQSIQYTINNITSSSGDKGSVISYISHLFRIFNSQNSTTKAALSALKTSLNNLAGQINNVKTDIVNQINVINKNSALRNIASSQSLLQNLMAAYQAQNSLATDFFVFKQLCGDYLYQCNDAFITLSEGLSDYISSVQFSSGWSKTEVYTQYAVNMSLLISSMTTLIDLNMQFVINELSLDPATMTDSQKNMFSQSSLLFNSYQRAYQRLQTILPQLYDTYYMNYAVQKSSYNDLTLAPNSLLIGLYRTTSGDKMDSLTQSKVGQKDITVKKYMIKSEWGYLDENNTWHNCPSNSFFKGFYQEDDTELHYLEELVCVNFANTYYDVCVVKDIPGFAATNQWANCDDGYFLTGFYRAGGDTLNYITKLTCCSVTSVRPSNLSYLDSLQTVTTSFKPTSGVVDLTNGTKGLVQYFKINQASLSGNFQAGYRSGMPVSATAIVDVVTTFDSALKIGKCDQDYFMWGFEQNSGTNFSHIEKLRCVKYANLYWETCTQQIVPANDHYWKCRNTSECTTNSVPSEARCADGSYLVGMRRNNFNNMQGLDQIVCCTISSTSGLYHS